MLDLHKLFRLVYNRGMTPEYRTWTSVKQRCYNPNHTEYHRYGARGIKVCKRWRSFDNFFADMGERPSKNYSIDRINNDKDYKPSNCRWATAKEQANNRRSNRLLTFNGKAQNMKQWATEIGIPYVTLYQRLSKQGWSVERALTETPVESKYITHEGKTMNIREWAEYLGIAYGTLQMRLLRGMAIDKAFQTKDLRF